MFLKSYNRTLVFHHALTRFLIELPKTLQVVLLLCHLLLKAVIHQVHLDAFPLEILNIELWEGNITEFSEFIF
jgi:hypothetical protein